MKETRAHIELCGSCAARLNTEIECSADYSGAVGSYCKHRSAAALVFLHHGMVCDRQIIRSSSAAIAQERFARYLAELAFRVGSREVCITTVVV